MTARSFVKSADTSTSILKSRSDLDKMLRRYGASSITMHEDIDRREITVAFVIPNTPAKDAPRIAVKLPVSVYAVYDALYGRPTRYGARVDGTWGHITDAKAYREAPRRLEQAERVAWRNLVLWVDAALSAASVGLQTVSEAFFAHTVVGERGERMAELIDALQAQLPSGVRALLAVPAETDHE